MRGGLGLFVLCVVGASAASASNDPVHYRLSPEFDAAGLSALQVEVAFRADASGQTTLDLPDTYGAGKDHWRYLHDLSVGGAMRVEAPDPAHRTILSAAGAQLTVRYRIVPPSDHDPRFDEMSQFEPTIRPTWFYAFGPTVFAQPHGRRDSPATFDWTGAPAGFRFASDLEHLAGEHRRARRPGTVRDVERSAIIGSRALTIVQNGPVRFASVGSFAFTPAQAFELVGRIQQAENGFWGDPQGPYLVTLGPVTTPTATSTALEGDGLDDGFYTRVTPNLPYEALRHFYAHEAFHAWNGGQLGKSDPDGRTYWFTEGVSDFYARRLLARAGLISPQDFAEIWNQMLVAYAVSPTRELPNEKIGPAFFHDPDTQRIPYQRGAMLAAIWDARLRASSGGRTSLDDVLRAQRKAFAGSPNALITTLFAQIAARYGLDVRSDVDRFIERGEPIELPADAFGPCVRIEWHDQGVFDRGWDLKATVAAGDVFQGVRPDSAAYRAGLRDGMRYLRRVAGGAQDAETEVAIRVRTTEGDERVIAYKPAGVQQIRAQRLVLTPGAPGCRGGTTGL